MSTTKNFTVNKTLPYLVTVKTDGKWDYITRQTFTTEGQTVSLSDSTTAYDGLHMDYTEKYESADKLDFSKTLLPQNRMIPTLKNSSYCLMPVGTNYANISELAYDRNFQVFGDLEVNNTTKIVKNFSVSNYIRVNGYPVDITDFELLFKIKTPSAWESHHMVVYGQKSSNYKTPQIEIGTDGKAWFGVTTAGASPWISIKSSVLETSTWYYIKGIWDGTLTQLSISTDGINWTTAGTKSANAVEWSQESLIGRDNDNSSVFPGEIDLSESYIKINGSNWWVPEILETTSKYKFDKTLKIYQHISCSSTATIWNFSKYKCVGVDANDIPLQGNIFYTTITTENETERWQYILKKTGFFTLHITEGHFSGYNYSDLPDELYTEVTPNTTYFISIQFLPTSKIYRFSTDKVNWDTYVMDDDTYYEATSGAFWFGHNNSPSSSYFLGSIDLSETYVTDTNGNIVWKAIEDKYETLPGCTYNFTDTGAATTLNAFVVNGDESIVLTPDNSYTNGWLLGTVSIPAHTTYTYNNGIWTEVE